MSKALKWTLGIIALLLLVGYLRNDDSDPVPTKPAQNSSYDGSVVQAEKYLKQNLKDPDSYQSIEWYKVVEINGTNDAGQHASYMVKHKYRAKNSFGGYNIQMATFYLDEAGNVVTMKND